MNSSASNEVQAVYEQLINAWNNRDARGMADLYANNGVNIGFDGSKTVGSEELFCTLNPSLITILPLHLLVKLKMYVF